MRLVSFPLSLRCATLSSLAHQIAVSCFAFYPFTFSFVFNRGIRTKLPAISQRYTYTVEAFFQESLLPSGFFFLFQRNFSLESQIILRGSSEAIYFYFPLSLTCFPFCLLDILTAIKETKHHYGGCRYLLCSACVDDTKLFFWRFISSENLFEVILLGLCL